MADNETGQPAGGRPRLGTDEFQRLLTEARAQLASLRAAAADNQRAGADAPAQHGEGAALDGLVQVSVGADGTVSEFRLDPRALRVATADLADGLRDAVNAALTDLRARPAPAVDDEVPSVDLAALGERVGELQSASLRQMELFSQTIGDVMAQLRRR